MFLLVALHPLGASPSTLTLAEVAWIATECVLAQAVPLLIASLWYIKWPVAATQYCQWLFVIMPIGFAADVLVFRGSGIHLVSAEFAELSTEPLPRLMTFFSWGMLVPLLAIAAYVTVGLALTKLLRRLAITNEWSLRVIKAVALITLVSMAMGSLLWLSQGRNERLAILRKHTTRHPLNAFGWYNATPIMAGGENDSEQAASEPIQQFTYDHDLFAEQISARMRQMRMNVVVETAGDTETAARPDVLIIICESLRSEMLAPDVMPHAHAAARSGWWLRQHYSGGNSTSLGIFSVVSGLESIWFYKSEVRFAPALNRLFRQAGYELGFFAGHDDWRAFQMDAFLSPRQFDRYDVEPMDWLASDRRSIAKAMQFLHKSASPATRPPRLAVLFLYSTHAPFAVADAQVIDQPAASADYPIPFPESWRESVWNRYRNAARTLDAALGDVLGSDAVIVLVGDHGESFLDDDTIGHGTKLSRAQTRTTALISGPMFSSREVHERTMHADILPTLLAAAGIEVSLANQFDGIDLGSATRAELRSRVFSISNLVGRDLVLVPPIDRRSGAEFGTRVEFSLIDETIVPRGRIDEKGDLIGPPDDETLRQWMERLVR